jgi:hypothetical protein
MAGKQQIKGSGLRMAAEELFSVEVNGGKQWDPLNLLTIHSINPGVLPHEKWWREAEIKHSRIAMLASVGAFSAQWGLVIPGTYIPHNPMDIRALGLG